jgi:hypothetical protein
MSIYRNASYAVMRDLFFHPKCENTTCAALRGDYREGLTDWFITMTFPKDTRLLFHIATEIIIPAKIHAKETYNLVLWVTDWAFEDGGKTLKFDVSTAFEIKFPF